MAKTTVQVGLLWQVWGKSEEIEIPETIDVNSPNAKQEILNYLKEKLDEIPLPTDGEYVDNSNVLDEEGYIEIKQYQKDNDDMTATYITLT